MSASAGVPKLKDVTILWLRCTSVCGASPAQVLVGCRCISASLASQTVDHALMGRVSKYLTSYSRLLIPPLLHVVHTLHTPTNSPPLSMGKCSGPADGLRAGVQSRLGSCRKERMTPGPPWDRRLWKKHCYHFHLAQLI